MKNELCIKKRLYAYRKCSVVQWVLLFLVCQPYFDLLLFITCSFKDQVKSGQRNPLRDLWSFARNKILMHVKNQKKSWSRPVAPPDPFNMQTLKKPIMGKKIEAVVL